MEGDVLASSVIPEDSSFDVPLKAVKATGNNKCSVAQSSQCPVPPFAWYVQPHPLVSTLEMENKKYPIFKKKWKKNIRSFLPLKCFLFGF